ncbi:hypothetical protein M426DRAFT_27883 [Hypoxylon sp. CI-4A]|nr:hypothetical protein M426DRAFT_27883 [Hypoxylon sp. CI-4A]
MRWIGGSKMRYHLTTFFTCKGSDAMGLARLIIEDVDQVLSLLDSILGATCLVHRRQGFNDQREVDMLYSPVEVLMGLAVLDSGFLGNLFGIVYIYLPAWNEFQRA